MSERKDGEGEEDVGRVQYIYQSFPAIMPAKWGWVGVGGRNLGSI